MDAFVYGTLREPARTRAVLGHADFGPDARLVGLRRVAGRHPTLAPGGETAGRVLRVDDRDLEALDAYEGLEDGLYVRVRVPVGEGLSRDQGALWVYVGDPDPLDADVRWPGEGPLRSRVEAYVTQAGVHVELA